MSKRAHLSFGKMSPVAVIVVGLLAVACGDDDGGNPSEGDAGAGKGGSEAGTGSPSGGRGGSTATAGTGGRGGAGTSGRGAGTGGTTGSGTIQEGRQCGTPTTGACAEGLACIDMLAVQTPVKICARPCTATGNECPSGEVCDSPYTNLARDAHCINQVDAPYEICGVGETSDCAGERFCLYFPRSTLGLCVNFCATDPTQDAGIAGLPLACPDAAQQCVSGVVAEEAIGVCGSEVARDAECGIDTGRFCMGDDVCAPDNPDDEMSLQHCRENCTETNTCAGGGTCTEVDPELSYCRK